MPLHVRRRPDTGSLEIYGTVKPAGTKIGIRVRQRAGSDNEATAREEAVALERNLLRDAHLGQRPDVRSFAEAVRSYVNHEPRTSRTLKIILRLNRYFGTMRLDQINQETIDVARSVVLRSDAAPATVVRNLIVPVQAVMRHAARRGWCTEPRFDLPSVDRHRPGILLPEQVEALIAAAAPHLKPLLRFLICTGCRLSEALALDWQSVDLMAVRATLWEGETKSGRRRVIDLVPGAVEALLAVGHRTGHVFLTGRRKPYATSEEGGGQIKTAWASACGNAGLPGEWRTRGRSDRKSRVRYFVPEHDGPHVLRHSWASYRYAMNPDPLRLMVDGGWSGLALVERYAHLMPAGHEDAIRRVWGLATIRQEKIA